MKVTKDDERARRICSLALEFMNARAPIPSSELARCFYPSLSPDSFRRSFARDREVLAACGLLVTERGRSGGEALWAVDEDASFARGVELSPQDAAVLELSCQALLDDPAFPFSSDLRLALAKIARTFSDGLAFAASPDRREDRALAAIKDALVARSELELSYTDARGRASRRVVAPYGVFGLRGRLYLVAASVGADGRVVEDGVRTYRVDRIAEASPHGTTRYEVPADFSVTDWRRLPFQMGDELVRCSFEVPRGREDALRESCLGQGRFERRGAALAWEVGAGDLGGAARWAISQGIRPVSPDALVEAWRAVLGEVLGDAS